MPVTSNSSVITNYGRVTACYLLCEGQNQFFHAVTSDLSFITSYKRNRTMSGNSDLSDITSCERARTIYSLLVTSDLSDITSYGKATTSYCKVTNGFKQLLKSEPITRYYSTITNYCRPVNS